MRNDEQRIVDGLFPWEVRRPYRRVFNVPKDNWKVEAVWGDGYLRAAETIVAGVVDGRYRPGIEGVPGVFLFRHYLELALKYIVFKARWLRDANTNAAIEDIKNVKKTHSLRDLWAMVKAECQGKIKPEAWDSWDISFIEQCIAEFDAVDPNPGDRFRYFGRTFGPDRDEVPARANLGIDFDAIAANMTHVADVLGMIDTYLHETHGQNQEWEDVLNSF